MPLSQWEVNQRQRGGRLRRCAGEAGHPGSGSRRCEELDGALVLPWESRGAPEGSPSWNPLIRVTLLTKDVLCPSRLLSLLATGGSAVRAPVPMDVDTHRTEGAAVFSIDLGILHLRKT